VFLLFCRHSADSRRVRENRRNGIKRSLGLSINSFSGSVGSRRIVNKKRQLAKEERERNQRKRYHTDRDSVTYLYRAYRTRQSWTVAAFFPFRPQQHRQSRRSQSQWQDTKGPASSSFV
jgi:hypothetical protein